MDIVDEAQEMYEREQWQAMLKRWLVPVICLIIGIIIATALSVWWHNRNQIHKRDEGDRLYKTLQLLQHQENRQNAAELLSSFSNHKEATTDVAILYKGALLAQTQQIQEAVTTYRTLAENTKADPILQALAQLRLCELMMTHNLETPLEIGRMLHKIVQRNDHPWVNQARELHGLQAFRDQAFEEAFERFDAIVHDKTASFEMRQRGRILREATLIKAPHLHDITSSSEQNEINDAAIN